MRISDGSADVCSAVLVTVLTGPAGFGRRTSRRGNTSSMTKRVHVRPRKVGDNAVERSPSARRAFHPRSDRDQPGIAQRSNSASTEPRMARSEEHTSELQSLMRISYAVFCLKKQNNLQQTKH